MWEQNSQLSYLFYSFIYLMQWQKRASINYHRMFFLETEWMFFIKEHEKACLQSLDPLKCYEMCIQNFYYDFVSGSVWPTYFMVKGRCLKKEKKVILCQFLNYPLRIFTFMHFAKAFIWRKDATLTLIIFISSCM